MPQDREFLIELDGQPGAYRVHVSSPAGDESVNVGFDPASLGVDLLEMLQARVLASATTSHSMRAVELERPLRGVGQALFEAVFQASAGALFLSSRNEVERTGGRLRIVLRLQPPELAVLPWELLFSERYGGYLCRRSPMVRYVAAPEPVRPLMVTPPLRVLGMTALPGDLAVLDADTEQRRLQQVLAPLQASGLIAVDWVPGQSWEAAQDALFAGCQVFHFIGHGGFDKDRGEGVIAFADERGRRQLVGASALADLLSVADPMPRLVMLNSCQTAVGTDTNVFSSTAATLVRTVPAVVAMQFAVTDDAAAVFSRAFYQALVHNRGVDEAVRAGRIALTGWNRDTMEWVTPVLYLRSRDTLLFDLPHPGVARDAPVVGQVPQAPSRKQLEEGAAVPGALPPVWNIPPRNPSFTGRAELLDHLQDQLTNRGRAVVQALRGWGGVGKTQLAIEFAHRHAGEYRMAWWIDAERSDLIGQQYAELAVALNLVKAGADVPAAIRAVRSHLQRTDQWLVVFDNAESPDDIGAWLPQGPGHVIITSRHLRWGEIAYPVDVDVFRRHESIDLLRKPAPNLSEAAADQMAEKLGDLPLALAQAGGYLTETGCSPAEYLDSLDRRASTVLTSGRPTSYPRSLAATVTIATEKLAVVDPAAVGILLLCAFLAPEPVPIMLLALVDVPAGNPDDPFVRLAAIRGNMVELRQCIGRITNFGLGKPGSDGLVLHRLTQAILRDSLTPEDSDRVRAIVDVLLVMADPGDPAHPATWPAWAQLMPHLLAVDPAHSANPDLRALACNATWYLLTRADVQAGLALAQELHERWLEENGPDDYYTMWAANSVARAWYDRGDVAEACELHEDTYRRRCRLLGEDHPQTLISANNVARDLRALGEAERAREVDEDTHERRRRLLGDDHFHTLISANNLARDLRILGRVTEARELDEDVLTRRRRILGEDHPHTLDSANSLARDLFQQNEVAAARELDERILAKRREILGDDHPHTLDSANNLARDLFALGEPESAYRMDEDTYARRLNVLGEGHRDTQISRDNLARDLDAMRRGRAPS